MLDRHDLLQFGIAHLSCLCCGRGDVTLLLSVSDVFGFGCFLCVPSVLCFSSSSRDVALQVSENILAMLSPVLLEAGSPQVGHILSNSFSAVFSFYHTSNLILAGQKFFSMVTKVWLCFFKWQR